MKITVTFDSLEEMYAHMRLNDGFEPIPVTLAKAEQPAQAAQEPPAAPEGFTPADSTPWDEKPQEKPAQAVTEDFRVEVRKALAALNKKTGQNTAKAMIKEMGVETGKLSDVALEDLPALMQKAKEAYNAG